MKFRVLGILSLVLLTILMIADFFSDHYLAINIQGYIFWILLVALVILVSFSIYSEWKKHRSKTN